MSHSTASTNAAGKRQGEGERENDKKRRDSGILSVVSLRSCQNEGQKMNEVRS